MDLDTDLDSKLSTGWVGFQICEILWILIWFWIQFCPWVGWDYGFVFLLGFGFGFGFIFFLKSESKSVNLNLTTSNPNLASKMRSVARAFFLILCQNLCRAWFPHFHNSFRTLSVQRRFWDPKQLCCSTIGHPILFHCSNSFF